MSQGTSRRIRRRTHTQGPTMHFGPPRSLGRGGLTTSTTWSCSPGIGGIGSPHRGPAVPRIAERKAAASGSTRRSRQRWLSARHVWARTLCSGGPRASVIRLWGRGRSSAVQHELEASVTWRAAGATSSVVASTVASRAVRSSALTVAEPRSSAGRPVENYRYSRILKSP